MNLVSAKICLFALSVIIVLAACDSTGQSAAPTSTGGAGSGQVARVRDLSKILLDGPTYQNLGPTSVIVKIDTTIPVVCAAAYGTTTAYGNLATDANMGGSAHSSHLPALSGLQPGTAYHLRLQGVGPDGTLYQSKDYTFHTPQAAPGAARRWYERCAALQRRKGDICQQQLRGWRH